MGQAKTKQMSLRAVAAEGERIEPQPILRSDGTATPLAAQVVLVTPEMAKRWLEKNHPNNRPVAYNRVEAFANDIRANAWRLTHQSVAFDGEGFLIDGQHRCEAIVSAGVAAELLVIYNRDGSYHDPIDRMGPRSVAVIMGTSGKDVACLNVLRMLEMGYSIHTPMTLHEAEGVKERHLSELTVVSTIPGRTKLTGPTFAALAWAMPVARERAIDFAVKAANGEMISRGHPAFAYRSWRDRNKHVQSYEQTLAALNCIRYHVHDRTIAQVTLGQAGYRSFCSRRRAMSIPNTPSVELVPPGNWVPSRGGDDD